MNEDSRRIATDDLAVELTREAEGLYPYHRIFADKRNSAFQAHDRDDVDYPWHGLGSVASRLLLCCLLAGCSGGTIAAPTVPATSRSLPASVDQRSTLSHGIVPAVAAHTTLYSFKGGADGANPVAGLVDVDGDFYGTTQYGGGTGCISSLGCGTVFKITKGGVESVIYRFKGRADGANPAASLVDLNGTLYGTTERGGLGQGTIFSVSTSGAEHVLHSFDGGSHDGDGAFPVSGLTAIGGTLYGASQAGGTSGSSLGALYEITPSVPGSERGIYSFQGQADGIYPVGGLVAVNGELYGTTSAGGVYDGSKSGSGTVFAISTSGTNLRELHTFTGGTDSGDPFAALIAISGELYGTTSGFGIGYGTVFKISTSGAGYKLLHTFQGGTNDGYGPLAGLADVSGVLYGTTSQAPAGDDGCVFKITTSGTGEGVVTGFTDDTTDGTHPQAALLYDTKLYGTTTYGGTSGNGTVFSLNP